MDVAVVQPGTPPLEWSSLTDGGRVDSLARMSDALLQSGPIRPHLLVWPEGSIPTLGDAERERRLYERLGLWAQARRTTLLAGAWTTGRSAPAGASASEGYRSAALLFGRGAVQIYERAHLVPLAEHVPFAGLDEVPPEAEPPANEAARYASGHGRSLMNVGGVKVATPIGAETLIGPHVAGFVADGADVIIAPAQTGWFAPAPIAEQHIRLSRLRAVEAGRAMLVASVAGPSALITPDGRITPLGADQSRATFHVEVPIFEGTTGYVLHGDYVWNAGLVVSGLLTLVGLAALAARRTAPRRRPARAPMGRPALAGA
jgi:apolipoprotein N-acyltransferase